MTASTSSKSDKKRKIAGLEVYDKHNIVFKTEESKIKGCIGIDTEFIDDEDIIWEE